MIKLIVPGSQNLDVAVFSLVKTAGGRLRGTDLLNFEKRAGSQLVDQMRNVRLQPGEVPIHMIAIGATEYYGPNRNGDGFKEAACENYHDTFVTKPLTRSGAYWYRNHQNKDTHKSYGTVKMSAYNRAMHRVELIVALNETKEAAERNGGLVADLELEKLANDREIGVSMACRVPYDVCSGCRHRARTRAEYCTERTCKYGGLSRNITKVAADGHVLHADNPTPNFFDISNVHQPADRIAYVLGHTKAAGAVLGGAAMAEAAGVGHALELHENCHDPVVVEQLKLAYRLAEIEERVARDPLALAGDLNRAFDPKTRGILATHVPAFKEAGKRDRMLNALAAERVLLTPVEFFSLAAGDDREKVAALAADVSRHLPGIYRRLIADPDLGTALASNPHRIDGTSSLETRRLAEKCAADFSLARAHVERRVMRSALQLTPVPVFAALEKAADERSEGAARRYVAYQLATVASWYPVADRELENVVRLNHIRA